MKDSTEIDTRPIRKPVESHSITTYHRPGCPALSVTASLSECTGDGTDGCAVSGQLAAAVAQVAALGGKVDSAPVQQSIAVAGTFRVYFNRHQAAPLVWCVTLQGAKPDDLPLLEIAVTEVVIASSTHIARTVYAPKSTPDDEDGKPSAWIQVWGVLRIDAGSSVARIG